MDTPVPAATSMPKPEPEPVLAVLAAMVTDPATLVVLLATVLGFLLPMLWIYPPVAPRPSDLLRETHSKLGVGWERISEPNKKADETDKGVINSLWVYPIKSCAGIRVRRSRVMPVGFEFDRLFTFAQLKSPFPAAAGETVGGIDIGAPEEPQKEEGGDDDGGDDGEDLEQWDFITQRQYPLLASLQVELWQPDRAKVQHAQTRMRADDRAERQASMRESFVVVRYPWTPDGWAGRWAWLAAKLARGWRAIPEEEVVLAASLPDPTSPQSKYARVRVWRDNLRAFDMSDELPRSLQLYLGVSNRLGLLRIDPGHLREIFRNAPRADEAGYQPVTGFQDAYPVHLLSRSSVRALETVTQLDDTLPDLDERRFRANIVVDGLDAYDEDDWRMVVFRPQPSAASYLDEARFHVCARCVRCIMPNIHPDTGDKHACEPDYAMRKFRDIDVGLPRWGCLGMQLTPSFPSTDNPDLMELVLEEGMSVDVLQKGAHRYIRI